MLHAACYNNYDGVKNVYSGILNYSRNWVKLFFVVNNQTKPNQKTGSHVKGTERPQSVNVKKNQRGVCLFMSGL